MQKTNPRLVCAALVWLLASSLAFGQAVKDPIKIPSIDANSKERTYDTAKILGIAIPTAMIAYGVVSLKNDSIQSLDCKARDALIEGGHCINNSADNYLAAAPAAAAFILKASGVESKSKTKDMIVMYALSNVAQAGVVFGGKSLSKRERPDGSDCSSFPSAHTAIAFTAAEFLHQEYGHKSPWISVGGYAVASAVGASRVFNNKHWVSDVVAGAGIGILCTKGVYWLYPSMKEKFARKSAKTQTLLLPDYSNGTMNMKLVHSF